MSHYSGKWNINKGWEELLMKNLSFGTLIVASLTSLAHAQSPSPAHGFLSDSDSGYAALAKIQKAICDARPSIFCVVTDSYCREAGGEVGVKIRRIYPGVTEGKIDEVIDRLCSSRATPYEVPGMHILLKYRLDAVRDLALKKGMDIPRNIVFGALPMIGVNAEVRVSTGSGYPILMVNVPMMEFANELAKISVQSIPSTQVGRQTKANLDFEASKGYIANNEELKKRFIALIDYFYGNGHDIYESPTQLSGQIQLYYTNGIETFVVAHEVGHILHGDRVSSFSLSDMPEALRKMLNIEKPKSYLRLSEVDADSFATSIIMSMYKEGIQTGDIQSILAPYAVKFYFTAHKILQDAGRVAGYSAPPPEYEAELKKDISKLAQCSLADTCNIRDMKSLSEPLVQSREYPPDDFRRDVIDEAISMSPIPSKDKTVVDAYLRLAEAMERNAQLLWQVTKTDFALLHANNREKASAHH
jgi:hypothetical protein